MANSDEMYSIYWEYNPTSNRTGQEYSLLLSATDGNPIGESWSVFDDTDPIPAPPILDIALNHNNNVTMAASPDGNVRMWQLDRPERGDDWKYTIDALRTDRPVLVKAALSPNGMAIAAISRFNFGGGPGSQVKYIKFKAFGERVGEWLQARYEPWDRFITAGFSNDNRVLTAVTLKRRACEIGLENDLQFWNPEPDTLGPMTQEEIAETDPERSHVWFSPYDRSVTAALGSTVLNWYRFENYVHFVETIECDGQTQDTAVLCSYSSIGNMLAVSFDSQIKIFRYFYNGKPLLPISCHCIKEAVIRAMFFENSRLYLLFNLASAMKTLTCCYIDVAVSAK